MGVWLLWRLSIKWILLSFKKLTGFINWNLEMFIYNLSYRNIGFDGSDLRSCSESLTLLCQPMIQWSYNEPMGRWVLPWFDILLQGGPEYQFHIISDTIIARALASACLLHFEQDLIPVDLSRFGYNESWAVIQATPCFVHVCFPS
jgi:hypothetical protein